MPFIFFVVRPTFHCPSYFDVLRFFVSSALSGGIFGNHWRSVHLHFSLLRHTHTGRRQLQVASSQARLHCGQQASGVGASCLSRALTPGAARPTAIPPPRPRPRPPPADNPYPDVFVVIIDRRRTVPYHRRRTLRLPARPPARLPACLARPPCPGACPRPPAQPLAPAWRLARPPACRATDTPSAFTSLIYLICQVVTSSSQSSSSSSVGLPTPACARASAAQQQVDNGRVGSGQFFRLGRRARGSQPATDCRRQTSSSPFRRARRPSSSSSVSQLQSTGHRRQPSTYHRHHHRPCPPPSAPPTTHHHHHHPPARRGSGQGRPRPVNSRRRRAPAIAQACPAADHRPAIIINSPLITDHRHLHHKSSQSSGHHHHHHNHLNPSAPDTPSHRHLEVI